MLGNQAMASSWWLRKVSTGFINTFSLNVKHVTVMQMMIVRVGVIGKEHNDSCDTWEAKVFFFTSSGAGGHRCNLYLHGIWRPWYIKKRYIQSNKTLSLFRSVRLFWRRRGRDCCKTEGRFVIYRNYHSLLFERFSCLCRFKPLVNAPVSNAHLR